jgi:hypothetical protein
MPEEKPKQTQLVAVQKDIALATGESVGMYARKIGEAATKWAKQKLNLGAKDASCYPVEIFSKSIILSIYVYNNSTTNGDEYSRSRYYAAAYARNKDGTFEFSALTEVEQVVGYQPKDSAAVTKAAAAQDDEASETVEEIDDRPGWQSIAKSLWNGVL